MSTQADAVHAEILDTSARRDRMRDAAATFAAAMGPLLLGELAHQTGMRGCSFEAGHKEVAEVLDLMLDGAKEEANRIYADGIYAHPTKFGMR